MDPQIKQAVDEAKALGHSVFSVTVAGKSYIYRTIKRIEFKRLQELANKQAKDANQDEEKTTAILESSKEELLVTCLLSPKIHSVLDLHEMPAGIIDSLSELIMSSSGFGVDVEPTQL